MDYHQRRADAQVAPQVRLYREPRTMRLHANLGISTATIASAASIDLNNIIDH